MSQINVVDKLKGFQGGLHLNLKAPTERKLWISGARKILQFHYRVQSRELYWIPMLNSLRRLMKLWESIGEKNYKAYQLEKYEAAQVMLNELGNCAADVMYNMLNPDGTEKIIEETRVVEPKKCSICSVVLTRPAYIVTRKGAERLHKSQPIGIYCLHAVHGKMDKLITTVEMSFGGLPVESLVMKV